MELLLLRSGSRNFPVDLEPELTAAGYSVSSLETLHAYIACPARARPQLLVLEIGNRADLDRALIVLDWNEHVQPLAATRYVLLMGSKNLTLGDRAAKLGSAEIATLPQPTRNLLFKLELQTRLLRAAPAPAPSKESFSARLEEHPGATHRRVLVVRGPSPKEGSWNQGEGAPSGKIRWRWVKSPGSQPAATDQFKWHVDSRQAPRFEGSSNSWHADPDSEVACEVNGETVYSAPIPEVIHRDEEEEHSGRSEKFIPPVDPITNVAGVADPVIASSRPAPIPLREKEPADRIAPAGKVPSAVSKSVNASGPEAEAELETRTRALKNRAKKETGDSAPSAANEAPAADASKARDTTTEEETAEAAAKKQNTDPEAASKPATEVAQSKAVSRARAALDQAKAALNSDSAKDPKPRPEATPKATAEPAAPAEKTALAPPKPINNKVVASSPALEEPCVRISASEAPAAASAVRATAELAPRPVPSKREPLPSTGEPTPDAAPTHASAAAILERKASTAPRGSIPEAVPTPGRNWIEGEKESSRGMSVSGNDPAAFESKVSGENLGKEKIPELIHKTKTAPEEKQSNGSVIPAGEPTPAEEALHLHPGAAPEAHATRVSGFAAMGPVVAESDQRARPQELPEQEDSRRFLKTRHFQLMTLQQLGDQDSSLHPMGKHRVYLSAQHRYYGLKDPSQALPLWIYEGELAPEFIDEQASWKFYDCLPIRIDSLNALPAEAFDALYRLCGLAPPVEVSAQPRSSSVVHIEAKTAPEVTVASVELPAKASPEPQEESAWTLLKRAVKGILK